VGDLLVEVMDFVGGGEVSIFERWKMSELVG